MKKLLFILPVIALFGCNSDVKDIENTMTGCEKNSINIYTHCL